MELVIPFDEADVVVIEAAVASYLRKQLTRTEMAEQVRAIAAQYGGDAEYAYEEIEEVLGAEVPELWSPPSSAATANRNRRQRERDRKLEEWERAWWPERR